jgi:hypothetical protein
MSKNGFSISAASCEHALQLVEQDLAAMARARAVEDEIRFTKYRLDVSPDNWSAAARLRLLNDVLDGMTKSTTQAPAPQPKPRNWGGAL